MNSRQGTRSGASGFTLVEILVVLVIIALLAAILFPVFARAREKSRQANCTSNLRQVAFAMIEYAEDSGDLFPPTMAVSSSGTWVPTWVWPNCLAQYLKTKAVLRCYSDPDRADPNLWGSYVTNGMVTAGSRYLAGILNPTETILLGERARNWGATRNASDPTGEYWDVCYDSWEPNGSWPDGMIGWPPTWANSLDAERHGDASVWGFVDGHSKWLKFDETCASQIDNLHDLQTQAWQAW